MLEESMQEHPLAPDPFAALTDEFFQAYNAQEDLFLILADRYAERIAG